MNKISSIIIEHLSQFGNGEVDVEIRRKPWHRNVAGYNLRVYRNISTSSAMRLARTVSGMTRTGVLRVRQEKVSYGTQLYVIPVYRNNAQ